MSNFRLGFFVIWRKSDKFALAKIAMVRIQGFLLFFLLCSLGYPLVTRRTQWLFLVSEK